MIGGLLFNFLFIGVKMNCDGMILFDEVVFNMVYVVNFDFVEVIFLFLCDVMYIVMIDSGIGGVLLVLKMVVIVMNGILVSLLICFVNQVKLLVDECVKMEICEIVYKDWFDK